MHPKGNSPEAPSYYPNKQEKDKSKTKFISPWDPDYCKNFKINPKTGKRDPDMPKTGIIKD